MNTNPFVLLRFYNNSKAAQEIILLVKFQNTVHMTLHERNDNFYPKKWNSKYLDCCYINMNYVFTCFFC